MNNRKIKKNIIYKLRLELLLICLYFYITNNNNI